MTCADFFRDAVILLVVEGLLKGRQTQALRVCIYELEHVLPLLEVIFSGKPHNV